MIATMPGNYVLMTDNGSYFVEYLLLQLVLSDSITKAMTFDTFDTAAKFQYMLRSKCDLECTINTFIP